MKTIIKKISILFLILFFIGNSSAEVLVNTNISKNSIGLNEIAFFTINFFNDGNELNGYPIRIETSENLLILENDQQIFFENIDSLKQGILKEVKIKFKAINTKKDIGKIFVYYGDNLQFVSGTFIKINDLPIIIKTSAQKNSTTEGEKIILNFELKNISNEIIYNIGAQAIAPNEFLIKTEPLFKQTIKDGEIIKQEFEILAPLEALGETKFTLAYGFFDSNEPHYFEENFLISFEKNNNTMLAVIGIIILVIAVAMYFQSGKKDPNIKGTGEK
ncbi:MAG: hypothetical protein PHX27_04320 [Candidatus ainarchaeum sp.]|nr:hypothetical protein [Candidatus ainarchaeum sp.]